MTMGKPEDIAQDVWEAAEDPAQVCFDAAVDLYETGMESGNLQLTIARAIMAERERCALLVESQMLCTSATGDEVLLDRGRSGNKVGFAYAHAIRHPTPSNAGAL